MGTEFWRTLALTDTDAGDWHRVLGVLAKIIGVVVN